MAIFDRGEGSSLKGIVASVLCAVLLVGCGGGGGGGDNGGGGPSGIGPNGGVAASSDGRASVTIPAGALSQDTAIAAAVASNPPAGNIGVAYDFGPDGTNFSQPVTISITYDDTSLPNGITESDVTLGTVSNNQWMAVANASIDTAANVVSGTTTHFSIYGVIAVDDGGVVPEAPTGVTAAAGDGQVTVSWNAVSGATSYNVYMAGQSGVTKDNYNTLTGGMAHVGVPSPFVHTGLTNGTTYYFVVTAVNATGEGVESSEESATPVAAVAVPNPPSVLLATAVSGSQINLGWTDRADNEDGFRIERKTGQGGVYSQIATVSTNITNHLDSTALLVNTTYCYRARAFNAVGNSGYSNESCVTTGQGGPVPPAPSGVTLTPGDRQIAVSWNAVAGATSYNVYIAANSGVNRQNYLTFPAGGVRATTQLVFSATSLSNGVTYYFVVTAVNANGQSAESVEVSGTPARGHFSPTGSMSTARGNHTVTLLSNGKVLIVGGLDSSNRPLLSAELYDPATGTVSSTGSMSTARSSHSATLLPNGKVLIAGGEGSGGALVSAELYDPATGTFSATGSMNAAHDSLVNGSHTATLLPNGQVLIAGGCCADSGFSNGLVNAELYDPTTGVFSLTGPMSDNRNGHVAALLSIGKVLVAGGSEFGDTVSLASAELYDPATNTFSLTGSMRARHSVLSAALLTDGKVLITGDTDIFSSDPSADAEIYNPGSGTFSRTGSMTFASRTGHTATLLPNGNVLIAGGSTGGNPLNATELYVVRSQVFIPLGPVTPRSDHAATLLPNGKVLLVGGSTFGSLDVYDPAIATFIASDSMTAARESHTATVLPNGKVLIAGGGAAFAEVYDPVLHTFSPTGFMGTTRLTHTATLLPSGEVLIAGGGSASAELYDQGSGTFSPTGSMGVVRWNHTAALLPSGKVLISGGRDGVGTGLSSAELFDPDSGTFTATGNMIGVRYNHTATLLQNGKVLIAGGVVSGGSLALASAELYDLASGTFTQTGSLNTARYSQTATLLPSGKVLLAGGLPLRTSAELYDPANGIFNTTGSASINLLNHAATLLSTGRVLIGTVSFERYDPATETFSATANGTTTVSAPSAALLSDGTVLIAKDPWAERYDPATNSFGRP